MVHGLETSKAARQEDSTTPSAKAVGHTARLNPKETPVDVFSELLRFAKVEAVDGQGPECFCQDVLEPDTKCLYCRATIAISQLWKERNSHYQLLSALKEIPPLTYGNDMTFSETLERLIRIRVKVEQAISAAEEGL